MLKLVIVTVLLGVAYSDDPDIKKCFTTKDGAVTAQDCPTDTKVKVCKGPDFDIEKGTMGKQAYGCGPCEVADKTNDKMCVECKGEECNKEKKKGTEFKCEKYTFADGKFTAAAEKTQCYGLDGVANICNKPAAEAKEAEYTIQHNGCGACDGEQKKAKKCEEVAGAAGLTAFLLPLLAALYTLF